MIAEKVAPEFSYEHAGRCPACGKRATFAATDSNFRSFLRCSECNSAPRHRALMHAIETYAPNWRSKVVHESSPGWDIVSRRLAAECAGYAATQYDLKVAFGETVSTILPCKSYRSENLECQTFASEVFDLVVMQDVFEHIFAPDMAVKEIARTLKDGGALIMTVPIVMGHRPSRRRASLVDGEIIHHLEAEYHGNPVDSKGALVTVDWGYDIVSYLQHHSGMAFQMLKIDNPDMGILGSLNEVLIGFKRPLPAI